MFVFVCLLACRSFGSFLGEIWFVCGGLVGFFVDVCCMVCLRAHWIDVVCLFVYSFI